MTRVLATAGYLAVTLTVSYAVWGPYDGVGFRPAWAGEWSFILTLAVLHCLAGYAIGRLWAVGLPALWAILSIPAGGYDTPLWLHLAFMTAYLWAPAVFAGVAVRRLAARRVRLS